ncbi:hypothetical protein [Massilia sp. Se16.2.3]|uniref:hypothetical protein n=1 Tax=Massilia sp. Se16.2.3 TaxID=2709303 RepID=UPI001E353710|nr:hypothetical protein [Massilia sp. Se16.2.3]
MGKARFEDRLPAAKQRAAARERGLVAFAAGIDQHALAAWVVQLARKVADLVSGGERSHACRVILEQLRTVQFEPEAARALAIRHQLGFGQAGRHGGAAE